LDVAAGYAPALVEEGQKVIAEKTAG